MISGRLVRAGLATVLVSAGVARADVIRVPDDHPSILVAVDAAVSGDSVLVAAGTWTDRDTRLVQVGPNILEVTSAGFLKPGITIIGAEGLEATIVDAGSADISPVITFLHALPGADVTRLEGLTITGGGTAIVATSSGRLELEACRLVDNVRTAMSLFSADVSLRECVVEGNLTGGFNRAALDGTSSSLELLGCRVRNTLGAGVVMVQSPSRVVIENCEISDHTDHGLDLNGVDDVYVGRTLFARNTVGGYAAGGGVFLGDCSGVVEFCVFDRDTSFTGGGGGLAVSSSPIRVENNTFYGCHAVRGAAVSIQAADGGFVRNVVTRSTGGEALWKSGGPLGGQSGCNVIWANDKGDFFGDWSPGMPEIFADPQLCDPDNGDFTVHNSSPCLAENSGGCGDIGAFGVGCGTVSMESRSWGRIKGSYR